MLTSFDFLDTKTALGFCMNDEAFYLDILRSYMAQNKEVELQRLFEAGDWENYMISVHALKSTSRTIGAMELSEKAKELEEYAKERNVAEIRELHESFLRDYRVLIDKIWDALAAEKKARQTMGMSRKSATPIIRKASKDAPLVLVVDDEAIICETAQRILEQKYQVASVRSGEACLSWLLGSKPDLILLDIYMPGMDGFAVLRHLKAGKSTENIPIIFMSADEEAETEIRGLREGASDFIKKPFIAEVLIARVSRIMELSTLQKNLRQEVVRQTARTTHLTREIMVALSSTVDAKDHYTSGHSQRVARYSAEIARRMGKSKQEQEDIYSMGLLHDIGKIGVPESIINKTSRLTDEEFAKIKEHPGIGYEILKNISEMPELATGARWHHERFDGRGYPDGLKGTEIPEQARIIGMADAYDAMTSKRSYSSVRPQAEVRAEIIRCKGSQFDPLIADVMIRMIDDDPFYDMREK